MGTWWQRREAGLALWLLNVEAMTRGLVPKPVGTASDLRASRGCELRDR